jgi:GntR family transcriptional regulator/MocR family aminotransferase
MVLPRKLAQLVAQVRQHDDEHLPLIEQRALANLINEGHLERHIKHTQLIYAKRRAATIQALTSSLRNRVTIVNSAGLHLVVRFSGNLTIDTVLKCGQTAAVPLTSTHPNYLFAPPTNEYKLAFAYTGENEIASNIARFAEALRSVDSAPAQHCSDEFQNTKNDPAFGAIVESVGNQIELNSVTTSP